LLLELPSFLLQGVSGLGQRHHLGLKLLNGRRAVHTQFGP
jgi:hypothetical protein